MHYSNVIIVCTIGINIIQETFVAIFEMKSFEVFELHEHVA